MKAIWRPFAGLCLIAVPALALAGAEPPREPTFTDTAEVTAVEIPVQVVLDGKPVRGLTAANFTVYQDKKKEAVTGFETVDLYAIPGGVSGSAAEVPSPARGTSCSCSTSRSPSPSRSSRRAKPPPACSTSCTPPTSSPWPPTPPRAAPS